MKFFKLENKDDVRHVIVLGNNNSGKKSFLLFYKDGEYAADRNIPPFNNISYRMVNGLAHPTFISFDLNNPNDNLIPSLVYKHKKVDAVLILVDLSSSTAKADLAFYTKFAKIHYKDVNALLVGTKADKQHQENDITDLIVTSAKTGTGFAEFHDQLLDSLSLKHTPSADLKTSSKN
ncbi:hypothetical protein Lsai_0438 [Legionella sainthelensi]|uniref:Uncharacterized protein n=2 Tax=Legionella sainthelensi TaxID=28087 RepID=A0A0W0YSC5_9GAMM|nr:hypothetical protein [Legionella sainthelensi]KTD59794.1 hypothetical protein Lsai_0438 [Legionella sainthelensi]VEH31471.1 Uncharacterised protein [Legionella sainthelensi]